MLRDPCQAACLCFVHTVVSFHHVLYMCYVTGDYRDPVFVRYMLCSTDTVLMTLITLYLFYCDI